MNRRECWRLGSPRGVTTITLGQDGPDDFTVTYGRSVKAGLTYGKAALELGACIMHRLALDDQLDNRTEEEAEGDPLPYQAVDLVKP